MVRLVSMVPLTNLKLRDGEAGFTFSESAC
jgi:hypothetical protein